MRSSYRADDAEILLKDVTGQVEPLPAEAREACIQRGVHYSEMIPEERPPSTAYLDAYSFALSAFARPTAAAVAAMASEVFRSKGRSAVLVSLARAGLPIGILAKRWLERRFGGNFPHYSVSIIKGRGIDRAAMRHILARHRPEDIQFIDGWTGKGSIRRELGTAFSGKQGVSPSLAVAADPAGVAEIRGTTGDILIPSACLNAVVSGLISRTFLRSDIIGEEDFHGAVYYDHLEPYDLSNEYLAAIESEFPADDPEPCGAPSAGAAEAISRVMERYGVTDAGFVRPGIGEATRVLLRRVPWMILLDAEHAGSPELDHIKALADERGAPIVISPVSLAPYKVCGIIKKALEI